MRLVFVFSWRSSSFRCYLICGFELRSSKWILIKDELHVIFNFVEIMFCFDVNVVPLSANGAVRGLIWSTYGLLWCGGWWNEISLRLKYSIYSFPCIFYFFAMQEGCTEISLRLRKKFTDRVLNVRVGMCLLCIVNLYTSWTEVMFDCNNLIEINPDVFPDPSACILLFISLTLFNYIVKKIFGLFLVYIGKKRYLCAIDNKCLTI